MPDRFPLLSRRRLGRLGLVAAASVTGAVVLRGGRTSVADSAALSAGPSSELTPLNTNWSFAGPVADPLDPGVVSWETVDLPHTVSPLRWRSWDPRSWEALWLYRRSFQLPSGRPEARYFLCFAGALTAAIPSLNGQPLGRHLGGYLPFDYEITGQVTEGVNQLDVVIDGRFDLDVPPDQPGRPSASVDFWQPAGLYRDVSLRTVPTTFVADVFAKPVDVLDPANRSVAVECTVDSSDAPGPAALTFALWDRDRCLATTSAAITVDKPGRSTVRATLASLPDIGLWDIDSPTLYQLVTTLCVGGNAVHDHQVRIGFREARFDHDGFWLNGTRRQLFGVNRHQFFPYFGAAAPARVQRRDAQILRDVLRCNMVRCAHYPQHEAFLEACDELGLLVWEEAPGWGYLGDRGWLELAARDVAEMIVRDRNHPSIVTWGVRLNETPDDTEFYTRTQRLAVSLDDSRQTTGAIIGGMHDTGNFQQDVFGYNDYSASTAADGSRQPDLLPPRTDRPYLVSEAIGTLSGPAKFYRRTDPVAVQQGQALAHARAHDLAAGDARYCGLLAWCGFDYPSGTGNVFQGIKWPGVVDLFRVPKLGAAIYRAQVDPTIAPVIEPAFYWDLEGEWSVGTLGSVALICSNAQRLELFVGGTHFASLTPADGRYPHLPHPPFIADFRAVDLAGRPELRIDAYLGDRQIASRSFSADRGHDRLTVATDDSVLVADGSDGTRVIFQCVDAYGSIRPYASGTVRLSLSGPAVLVGDNPFPIGETGGTGAVWIRTRAGQSGSVVLRAAHDSLGSDQATVTVVPVGPT